MVPVICGYRPILHLRLHREINRQGSKQAAGMNKSRLCSWAERLILLQFWQSAPFFSQLFVVKSNLRNVLGGK